MLEVRDTAQGKTLSVGYPAVEDLIESENFDTVNQALETAYKALDELSSSKGGLKTSKNARKAMKSIELVMDLLRELLVIKYQMQEMGNAEKK